MSKHIKSMIMVIVSVMITAIGASIMVKANVGVGAYEALSTSMSHITGIKIGTLGIILNITCVFIQWLLLKKDFPVRQFFQIAVSLILGQVVNVMLYTIFAGLTIDHYFVRVLMVLTGGIICSVGVGFVMALNYISMPLEGACMAVSEKFNVNFGKVRQTVDVLLIIAALSLAFFSGTDITIREGTILTMLIFPASMNFVYEKMKATSLLQTLSAEVE